MVPVIFSSLIGVNLLVWNNSRINYVFIFGVFRWSYLLVGCAADPVVPHAELDLRTKLDHREYFEVRYAALLHVQTVAERVQPGTFAAACHTLLCLLAVLRAHRLACHRAILLGAPMARLGAVHLVEPAADLV